MQWYPTVTSARFWAGQSHDFESKPVAVRSGCRMVGRRPPHFSLVSTRPILLLLVGVYKPPECPVLLAPINGGHVVELGFLAEFQVVLQMIFTQLVALDRRTNRTTRFAPLTTVGIPAVP